MRCRRLRVTAEAWGLQVHRLRLAAAAVPHHCHLVAAVLVCCPHLLAAAAEVVVVVQADYRAMVVVLVEAVAAVATAPYCFRVGQAAHLRLRWAEAQAVVA